MYYGADSGFGDIYSMDSDGSDKLQLTADGLNAYPGISPDGSRVVYMHIDQEEEAYYIATVKPDGSENVVSSTAGYYPGWMPSGNRIQYADYLDSFYLKHMNIDESDKVDTGFLPTGFEGYIQGLASWNNDSTEFAYPVIDGDNYVIYTTDTNVAGGSPLTTLPFAFAPRYSPDGNKVFFLGSTDGETIYLYSINSDGTNQTAIQELPVGSPLDLQVSPDGSKVLYQVEGGPDVDMYVLNTDGSNIVQIPEDGSVESDFVPTSWSPDSSKLVYVRDGVNDDTDIFTINADGTGLTNLTNTPDQDELLNPFGQSWAPVPGSLDDDEGSEAGDSSVLTTTLPTTNKPSYLVLPSSTSNASFTPTPSSTVPQDSNGLYSYPTDLASFQFDTDVGATETITLYFDLPGDPTDYTARKYNDTTKEFTTIENATITREDYNNTSMLKLTYQITDGGTLDQDNTTNGTIVDPVGLATTTGSPDTGLNQHWLLSLKY